MTSREAVVLIQEIQSKFQKKFKLLDLMDAWPQLLTYRADAMAQVAGRIIKSSKFLPKMDYVLTVLGQLDRSPVQLAPRIDKEKEARAAFKLMDVDLVGEDRVDALYWLADRTQKPHYAFEAWEMQQKILAEIEDKPVGNNLETSVANW